MTRSQNEGPPRTRTITVDYLTRVEGEGSLKLMMRNGRVESVKLSIFEAPRFFEALLQGRTFTEAPDITARICGICPVAYQMSAVHAMESACRVSIPRHIRQLRRLLYCGEWIASHTLHIYMLNSPDLLGLPDAMSLARIDRDRLLLGLKLKKAGNEILRVFGGREIHPINVKVGGFYRLPQTAEVKPLVPLLKEARDDAANTLQWVLSLPIPDVTRAYDYVALTHPSEYPMNEGNIASTFGLSISPQEYEQYFTETQVPHSTALHSTINGRGIYLTGPLARYNLNYDSLHPSAKAILNTHNFPQLCANPHAQIVIRAAEVLHAVEEALMILGEYDDSLAPAGTVIPQAATACWATEAPRGLLYHRYTITDSGIIKDAKLVPPTSQNQPVIEDDLREVALQCQHLEDVELTTKLEQTIRNYDPCISCATHFLRIERVALAQDQ